jgi:RpiR family carbohydrate utilization transcriptional regulator
MPRSLHALTTNINLSERIDQLSIRRQEIFRPILEHPREYVLLSVRALADRLHTDPATIVRIVHALGFPNYKEFQQHLHELSLAFATSLDTMLQAPQGGASKSRVRESVFRDMKNVQAVKNSLDPKRFVPLAQRMYSARRIVVLGGDLAAILAEYLGYHLNVLGLPVFVASSLGSMTHSVRSVMGKDLVIAMTFRRAIRQTVDSTEQARQNGAHCVGITDTYLSPLARICHETFLASIDSVFFGASFTAPVTLLNGMLTAVGEARRSRTMAIVRQLDEEQRRGIRWYDAKS